MFFEKDLVRKEGYQNPFQDIVHPKAEFSYKLQKGDIDYFMKFSMNNHYRLVDWLANKTPENLEALRQAVGYMSCCFIEEGFDICFGEFSRFKIGQEYKNPKTGEVHEILGITTHGCDDEHLFGMKDELTFKPKMTTYNKTANAVQFFNFPYYLPTPELVKI